MAEKNRTIRPLTREAFAPFGDLIEIDAGVKNFPINYGHTRRYHDLARLELSAQRGRPSVSLFRSQPLPSPIAINIMERHPLSSQLFMPLGPNPYLVVVAPPGDFDENAIEVFVAEPGQGVNYHAGTWHHFCLALWSESDFLVIDRGGEGDNCDEVTLQRPFSIDISLIPHPSKNQQGDA